MTAKDAARRAAENIYADFVHEEERAISAEQAQYERVAEIEEIAAIIRAEYATVGVESLQQEILNIVVRRFGTPDNFSDFQNDLRELIARLSRDQAVGELVDIEKLRSIQYHKVSDGAGDFYWRCPACGYVHSWQEHKTIKNIDVFHHKDCWLRAALSSISQNENGKPQPLCNPEKIDAILTRLSTPDRAVEELVAAADLAAAMLERLGSATNPNNIPAAAHDNALYCAKTLREAIAKVKEIK